MLSEEYRGRVSIDPSLAIGIALSAVMLAMFVLVAIGPGAADSASVFYSYLCSLNPQQ